MARSHKKPTGRPSTYTEEVAALITERLSKGEPLAQICRDDGMPAVRTVSDWKRDHETFSAAFVRARDDGYDAIAAQCLEIANNPLLGEETLTKPNGDVEVKSGDMLGHRKLMIETRLKLLAKWDPKRYGEKLALAGDADNPLQVINKIELVAFEDSAD